MWPSCPWFADQARDSAAWVSPVGPTQARRLRPRSWWGIVDLGSDLVVWPRFGRSVCTLRGVFTATLAELVAAQAGVVSLGQVVAAGVPSRTAQRWARTWRRLHPGVYLVAGHRLTPEGRARAALLWAGKDAVLTAGAAACWHGLPSPPPGTIQITLPVDRKPRSQRGLQVRRRNLDPIDVGVVRGIKVAVPALAALETAVALPDGSAFLDRVLQRHVRFPDLSTAASAATSATTARPAAPAAHCRSRPGRLRRRAPADPVATAGGHRRVAGWRTVRDLPDRRGVPRREGGDRGGRVGLARGRRPVPQ